MTKKDTMEQRIQPTRQLHVGSREGTKAGLPEPTTSSKLEGVSSITLLAVALLRRDNMQATKEATYIKERVMT